MHESRRANSLGNSALTAKTSQFLHGHQKSEIALSATCPSTEYPVPSTQYLVPRTRRLPSSGLERVPSRVDGGQFDLQGFEPRHRILDHCRALRVEGGVGDLRVERALLGFERLNPRRQRVELALFLIRQLLERRGRLGARGSGLGARDSGLGARGSGQQSLALPVF